MNESKFWGMRGWVGVLALSGGLLHAATAGAQASERRVAAQALFNEGGQLFRQGKFEAACQKLAQSQELDPATGTLLNLARCYEKVGKTASAWLAYSDSAASAKAAGQHEREETARRAAARLAPQLPKLLIRVPDALLIPELEITRDSEPLSRALWNVAAPTDPGQHTLLVKAPNRKPWSKSIRLAPAEEMTLDLPPLEELPHPPSPVPQEAPNAAQQSSPTAHRSAPSDPFGASDSTGGLATQHVLALSAAVLGVAGVAVGTGFALSAKSNGDKANRTCAGSTCPDQAGLDANRSAIKQANMATVFFGLGAVCLAGGAALWFTSPSLAPHKAEQGNGPRIAGVSPLLDSSLRGLLVEGRF